MKLQERLMLRGDFRALIREADKVVWEYHDPNLIVNAAKDALAQLISVIGASSYVIQYFAMGDGHHAVGDILTPVDPTATETALENELFRKSITSVTYPASGQVQFNTIIERTEANGSGSQYYTEAGLFSDAGMFSIKSFPAMVKNADREFEFNWKIIF